MPSSRHLTIPHLAPGAIPWTLLGFILLSAAAHVFGFYVFQAIYPPAAHVPAAPVQVSFLRPGTPEADAMLRWIDAEDPALAAEPAKARIPGLTRLPYIPSFSSVRGQPSMPAPAPEPLPYPAGASGLDLIRMAAYAPKPPEPAPAAAPTALEFSDSLRSEVQGDLPPFASLRSGVDSIEPARFLMGVSPKGEVQYVFLQGSGSGDKNLDTAAGRLLEQTHFRETGDGLRWGFATFHWGSDVFAPAAP